MTATDAALVDLVEVDPTVDTPPDNPIWDEMVAAFGDPLGARWEK